MKKSSNPNVDDKGDYILRWKLNAPKMSSLTKDPFRTLINDLLKELLDIVSLTYKGDDIKVDGFHFLNDTKVFKLYKRIRT